MSTPAYKKDTSKQARACTSNEFQQCMDYSVITADGKIDEMALTEKYGFVLTTSFCVRSDEIHRGLQDDIEIKFDENNYIFADFKIYYDKSRTSACPISVMQLYFNRKQVGINYLQSNGRMNSTKNNNNNNNDSLSQVYRNIAAGANKLGVKLPMNKMNVDNNNNNNNKEVNLYGGSVLSRVLNDENHIRVGEWNHKNCFVDNCIAHDVMVVDDEKGDEDVVFAGVGVNGSFYNINRAVNNQNISNIKIEEWNE